MSQEAKTIACLAVALVTGLVAFTVSREAEELSEKDVVGKPFIVIDDPLEIQSLRIVKFDSEAGEQEPFEVMQKDGLYVIKSAENYPADAQDHLVDAVNVVNNLEILQGLGSEPGSHANYGVVDPTSDSLGRGAVGAGTRITMSTLDGETLADFIVGKQVKGSEGQCYVRQAEADYVYVVKISPEKLSTKFEEWIERDLLKLDPIDLSNIDISDYTLVTQAGGFAIGPGGARRIKEVVGIDMNSNIALQYDKDDLEWKLEKLTVFERNEPKEIELGPDQELDKTKLDDMKYALDDLEIVGVRRKTKGLQSARLEEFVRKNPEAVANLEDHGFYFRTLVGPDGEQSLLLSNNGEFTVGMSDGVKYVLRFGDVAGAEKDAENKAEDDQDDEDKAGEEKDAKAKDDANATDSKDTKVLRYLMVTANFDEKLLAAAELEDVPLEEPPAEEAKPDPDAKEDKDGDKEPVTDEAQGQPGAAEDKPAEGAAEQPADASDAAEDKTEASSEETAGDSAETDAAPDSGDSDSNATTDEPQPQESESNGPKTDDAKEQPAAETTDTKKDSGGEDASQEDEEAKKKKLEDWKRNREAIIQENERKQKEFDEKVANGQKRVEELNERFSDWYYVISDATYRKIRLGEKEIIKTKEKEDAADSGDAPDDDGPKSPLEKFDDLKGKLPDVDVFQPNDATPDTGDAGKSGEQTPGKAPDQP